MKRLELADRIGDMWKSARNDAGKSQEWLAKALGVSKTTIQNWENGLSSPQLMQGLELFQVLGLNPLPYFLKMLFPKEYGEHVEEDSRIDNALHMWANSQSRSDKKKLHYWTYGDHGSSPKGVLELITAYLHLPLQARVVIAHEIELLYKMEKSRGQSCG